MIRFRLSSWLSDPGNRRDLSRWLVLGCLVGLATAGSLQATTRPVVRITGIEAFTDYDFRLLYDGARDVMPIPADGVVNGEIAVPDATGLFPSTMHAPRVRLLAAPKGFWERHAIDIAALLESADFAEVNRRLATRPALYAGFYCIPLEAELGTPGQVFTVRDMRHDGVIVLVGERETDLQVDWDGQLVGLKRQLNPGARRPLFPSLDEIRGATPEWSGLWMYLGWGLAMAFLLAALGALRSIGEGSGKLTTRREPSQRSRAVHPLGRDWQSKPVPERELPQFPLPGPHRVDRS